MLQLFAPSFLSGFTLLVLRVNYQGKVDADVLRGPGAYVGAGAVLVNRGHMRALTGSNQEVEQWIELLQATGRISRDVDVEGWADK